jgi:serine protease
VPLRRLTLLIILVLGATACGGGMTGVIAPTPTPPPPGGIGTVTGSVGVTASALPAAGVPARPARSNAGRPVLVPDQLLVKFRLSASAAQAESVHAQAGGTVVTTVSRLNVQVVRLRPGSSAAAALAAYRASPLVEFAEQDAYTYATAVPNDPSYGSQWHYPQINLPAAWNITTGSPVIVAVLDTGDRTDHPDRGNFVQGFDYAASPDDSNPTDPGCGTDPADQSHGTHVAGTIAALTNNGVGVAGVNWAGASGTRIMAVRVIDGCGSGLYSDLASGITYAADHGARVINMSLGGSADSVTVDNAISYARGLGVTLVAAAGNSGCVPPSTVLYPARNANVIAVSATTNTNALASYSSCGPEVDVAAPGGSSGAGVLSTTWSPAGGHVYASFQGTSMATPHVSGVAALIIAAGAATTPAAIQARLESTATDLGAGGKDSEFGSGLINASGAVSGGAAASQLRVFSGVISGTTITRQSDIVVVATTGSFMITNAQTGIKTVFAWQDFNGNGVVDTGDSYGTRAGVTINNGITTSGVSVTVQRYSGPALTVN